MTSKKALFLSTVPSGCLIAIGLWAQQAPTQPAPTEAPAGFNTPTLITIKSWFARHQ